MISEGVNLFFISLKPFRKTSVLFWHPNVEIITMPPFSTPPKTISYVSGNAQPIVGYTVLPKFYQVFPNHLDIYTLCRISFIFISGYMLKSGVAIA